MFSTVSRLRLLPLVLLPTAVAFVVAVPSQADAADILLTGGNLEARGSTGSGPLVLSGDRGFAFSGATYTGSYFPGLCNGSVCAAGDRISLLASWGGSDVAGTATLDGVTYPRVGDNFDIGPLHAALSVEFAGSIQLPRGTSPVTLVAPFAFNGTFFYRDGRLALVGSGTATIDLRPILGYPEERWAVSRVIYRLGSRLPAGTASNDVGAPPGRGRASLVQESVVVIGDGADIWGVADSFHFAYRELPMSALVTARLVTQQPIDADRRRPSSRFAKSGVMVRGSTAPDAPSVILDVKPDGEIEFMVRYVAGSPTLYLGGAPTSGRNVWLSLWRRPDGAIEASYSHDAWVWTTLGAVTLEVGGEPLLAGLAVTSHDPAVLNGAVFDHVAVTGAPQWNLLTRGDFEDYEPPALGPPGWISDHALRQVAAKSETHQPRSGAKNGACWTPEFLDCGIYQEVVAPATGLYAFSVYAATDRSGALIGADVNGRNAVSTDLEPTAFGDYRRYTMTFEAAEGDTIHVWMYSPAQPGYVVIDDVSLSRRPD